MRRNSWPTDTWLVFRHALDPTLRNPFVLAIGLVQPLLYLLLFGPLLVTGLPGASWEGFLPGILVMLAMFGAGFAGFSLIPDQRAGVLDRMRVSPLSRTALLLGRVLRDTTLVVVQAVLITALAALLFGLTVPLTAILLGLGVLALLSITLASASYLLALRLTNEYEFAPVVQSLSMPLLLLSGFLIPMEAGPDWLRLLSRLNPMTYVVDAERSLFVGEGMSPTTLTGIGASAALATLALLLGTRAFRTAH
ncbi:ABC-2 type transport system permease protein [Saccharopolyspora erythraea NRRL 2338]|uniref:Transport permease protein n=2 Tax=Saccharopolyspora erythraea TaxID=1836 RepID=A4F7W3_SACEN|nr:ABC transporter permease [Saccharopolyspora erythraea]EQD85148.1 multidrug ABC transporter permease [Saccharopolyspora erythraea D]PFG93934.1 ABC-2 type transport system permease protein [Saccharopolyspora erythraea NRRL 2338]QRK90757.1 ABC transporter permease [Saccharopolyspora erythraea]CAM00137.1 putative ABC transporter, integral membrane subunit [Saccharopolyspora erythraea NRRL 2338]